MVDIHVISWLVLGVEGLWRHMFHPLSQVLPRKSRNKLVFMVDIHMWMTGLVLQ